MSFGGGEACPVCEKKVYFAEKALGPQGKSYHKACLVCTACKKSLDSTNLCEKDSKPYCKACYGKNFGPKGFGFAGGAAIMHTN
ncbi:hypothetical protein DFA_08637 [Cavenderia fasciculata]|uniref:LIM zinc-binding domain-containing protein n=1 Tax=Cavenderia fasciculata TaxID=261658 RepID=F4Q3D1_CACFS|nr:uncharacterized protein DFA_08637 [Cavenderia fasciculata]EGG17641.1 hypothetical protein DFA_08637 [Cavenderia fasciculata]|eukprot:XP_004356125.1 hypothetical protein DFA_08637 [Cavenderia fasciculata]